MKNVTFLLLFAVSFLAGKEAFAQKTLKSGSIKMEMTMDTDDPQLAAQLEMMGGGTMNMEILFRDGKTRTNINGMGGMMDMSTILDMDTKKGLVLQNMMGQKMASPIDKEAVEAQFDNQEKMSEDVEIIKTTETVEILGYTCQKYLLKNAENTSEPIQLFVTDAFKIPASQFQAQYSKGVDGFPLRIVMSGVDSQPMSITIEATEVSKKAPAKELFDLSIPDGYEEMDASDLPTNGGM